MFDDIQIESNSMPINLDDALRYSLPIDEPEKVLEQVEKGLNKLRTQIIDILNIDSSDCNIAFIDESLHEVSEDEQSVTMPFKEYDTLMKTLEAFDTAFEETYQAIEEIEI